MGEAYSKYTPKFSEFCCNCGRSGRLGGMAVSEVRGKCEFCQYVGKPPSYAPCASCYRDEGRPGWRANGAAVYALGLESDLADARAELERNSAADLLIENARLAQALRNEQDGHHPEERVGSCFCGICIWGSWGMDKNSPRMVVIVPDSELPPKARRFWCSDDAENHEWRYCPDCGAHLGADGIARRWRERDVE